MRERDSLTGRPAAEILAAILFDAEQRAKVRAHIAETGTSLRQLARQIGFSNYRLRSFLEGTEPWGEDQQKLDRWCADKPLAFVHAEEVATLILSRWGTAERRAADRRALAEAILNVYRERGFKAPGFIEDAIRGS